MDNNLYLSLIPESLVASMLPPRQFGAYLATGTRKRPHGQAMFFEVRPGVDSDYFDLAGADARCVPHPDGQPKHSVYVSVYRVLEHVPREALGSLFLTTAHGKVLEIPPGAVPADANDAGAHLYQELAPVHPLIASALSPQAFCRHITDADRPIHVPRICFADLELGELTTDPAGGAASGLPYAHLDHIRHCLLELRPHGHKETKTVDRVGRQGLIYRSVKSGFYVGDAEGVLYYRYPTRNELESTFYDWWRCANDAELQWT
ncbi:MAG: hypothetical protein ACOC95_04275 [Planctomycetota bacterium]